MEGLYKGSPMMGRLQHNDKCLGMDEKNPQEIECISCGNVMKIHWIFLDIVDVKLPPRPVLWPAISHNTLSQTQVLIQFPLDRESI